MDRFYNNFAGNHNPTDYCLTAYVALFIASKNSEVEPLSLRDIRDHFLKGATYTRSDIVKHERAIRLAIKHENDISYLFDFVMLYIKIWKISV